MKRTPRRRGQYFIAGGVVLFFIAGLFLVDAAWPQGFAAFVAIGGVAGAVLVLYEVRLTKQLAQAEFIRDLQSSFASDGQIMQLWQKLLLDEEVLGSDRHLMSSYLTFFETIQLLHTQGALKLDLIDELFRNRFFTAIGHPAVLRHSLLKSVSSFTNIHRLIGDWYHHLLERGKPIHPGYYRYVEAVVEAKGFAVAELGPGHLNELLGLQQRVLGALDGRPWLRENTAEVFADALRPSSPHLALGAMKDGALVAAAVLYDPGTSDESIRRYFTDDEAEMQRSINLKLVLVDTDFRRYSLASALVKLLEQRAFALDRREVLCTIHPRNVPSRTLFSRLGYQRVGKVSTKYGRRLVYGRRSGAVDAHWIR